MEVAFHMELSQVLPPGQIIFMRTNDINAANTSGPEMLYAFPSSGDCEKVG